ncbi:MAG: hypothetical protein WCC26_21445 [Terracidiphilus sp.]
MASIPESVLYRHDLEPKVAHPTGWVRVGIVAAASALAGGVAAAWYYRKTLARLRQAEEAGFTTSTQDSDDF